MIYTIKGEKRERKKKLLEQKINIQLYLNPECKQTTTETKMQHTKSTKMTKP